MTMLDSLILIKEQRIFYQSPDSAIHAFYTDNFGATWAGGDAQIMVQPGLAMAGTPMSTVMWTYNGVSLYQSMHQDYSLY